MYQVNTLAKSLGGHRITSRDRQAMQVQSHLQNTWKISQSTVCMNEEMDKTKCWRSNNTLFLTNNYGILSSADFPNHGWNGRVSTKVCVDADTTYLARVHGTHCISPITILIDYNDKVFIFRLFPPIPGSTSVKSSLHGPRPRPSTFSFTYLSSSQNTAGGIESTSTSIWHPPSKSSHA